MPEIYFSSRACFAKDLIGNGPDSLELFKKRNGLSKGGRILQFQAYSLDLDDPNTPSVVRKLNALPHEQRKSLVQGVKAAGNQIHVLQRFFANNLSLMDVNNTNGLVGAGVGAMQNRLTSFQRLVAQYEATLLELKKLQSINGPGIGQRRMQAERRARDLFRRLQSRYQVELNQVANLDYRYKNRGNALNNADRGIVLATRNPNGRPDPRLFVRDLVEAGRLGAFARFLSHVGRMATILDAAIRVRRVQTIYIHGGNWMRESAIQMTGFGLGGAAGAVASNATVEFGTLGAAELGLMVAGPIGWAIIAVIIGFGLYAGYEIGSRADIDGQYITARVWDRAP